MTKTIIILLAWLVLGALAAWLFGATASGRDLR